MTSHSNEGDYETSRRTVAETRVDDPTIHVDRNFYRLKNSKRREALLQHEVGHTKMHNNVGDAKHMSKDLKSKKGEELNVDVATRNVKESLINSGRFPKDTIEIYMDSPGFKYELDRLRREYQAGGMSENEVRSKLRETAMQKLSKYQSKNNAHANVAEFEADRHAANKAGTKNIKKGVREAYTRQKRDVKDAVNKMNLDNKTKKKAISETNKVSQDDMNRRSKALADKSLTQKEKDNYR